MGIHLYLNALILLGDQDRISPYNISSNINHVGFENKEADQLRV